MEEDTRIRRRTPVIPSARSGPDALRRPLRRRGEAGAARIDAWGDGVHGGSTQLIDDIPPRVRTRSGSPGVISAPSGHPVSLMDATRRSASAEAPPTASTTHRRKALDDCALLSGPHESQVLAPQPSVVRGGARARRPRIARGAKHAAPSRAMARPSRSRRRSGTSAAAPSTTRERRTPSSARSAIRSPHSRTGHLAKRPDSPGGGGSSPQPAR